MVSRVSEVVTITEATNWYFSDSKEPVVCFALVSVYSTIDASLEKQIIGLSTEDMGSLQGMEILPFMQSFTHKSEL